MVAAVHGPSAVVRPPPRSAPTASAPQETSRYPALTRPRISASTAIWRIAVDWEFATPMPTPESVNAAQSATTALAGAATAARTPVSGAVLPAIMLATSDLP